MKELLLPRFKNEGMKDSKNERMKELRNERMKNDSFIPSFFHSSLRYFIATLLIFLTALSNELSAKSEKLKVKSENFTSGISASHFSLFTFHFSLSKDTIPLRERTGDYLRDSVRNSFDLRDPSVIEKNIEFDPVTYQYYITEKIGTEYYRTPTVLTFDEYVKYKNKQQEEEYFERLSGLNKRKKGDLIDPLSKVDFSATQNNKLQMLIKSVGVNGKLPAVPKLDAKKMGDNLIGLIFGDPPTVDIRPQGQIDLTLGGDYRYYGNPTIPTFARTTGGLLFNMDIQMRVTGKIGNKLNLNTAFNNKAQFDFDNIMKLNYNTNVFGDDDIIKNIEAGNVNLPLRGTLIQGSQNLFGIKTELQFGYLRLTAIAAQQRNRKQNIQVQGGSTLQNFAVNIDQYDENRHFFLTHFNRGTYEKALRSLPLINSLFTVTKMEVWVSNDRNEDREIRQIVALSDLGETSRFNNKNTRLKAGAPTSIEGPLPDNASNDVYEKVTADKNTRRIDRVIRNLEGNYGFVQGLDYVKRSAKRLQANEYTFNPKLGTISINNIDRQQVMGVAFTYFYNGQGPFQVGEFAENIPTVTGSDSVSQVVFCKLLKNNTNNPTIPLFDLMMKNVYSINAFVQNPQDLRLDIYYQDAGTTADAGKDKAEKRSLSEIPDVPLLRLLNLDRLNQSGDPQPDGLFDFVPDVTINTKSGRIYFPVLEPFGRSLRSKMAAILASKGLDTTLADRYPYYALYDSTLFQAQQNQSKNRFVIKGQVKSTSSNKIQLQAFGLKPGAVTVTAGGIKLLEGVDFAIDYGTALLTVLNPAYVSPNINLNVAIEDNSLFNFQTRTMLGLRADYAYKKNFNIGATYMNLFEIPYLRKVNFGDDPINNKVFGLDLNFTEDAPWLTRLVDKLPFIQTKEASKITFAAETAVMKPGHASAIDGSSGQDQHGVVYLDDFEGSSSPFSLTSQTNAWSISSVPQKHPLWKEANDTTIISGANRALLNWYRIDNYLQDPQQSANLGDYTTSIQQTEVFPNKTSQNTFGINSYPLYTFDLSYYPKERGPYNYDEPDGLRGASGALLTKGLSNNGGLNAPETRWAGIQRGMTTTDFEAANIEYLDFWMLDPFRGANGTSQDNSGQLLIHLGEISEDILKDGRKTYENGLPSPSNPNLRTDPSIWGRVPRTEIPLPNSFSADDADRVAQDIGLDGLNDGDERDFKRDWLAKIQSRLTAQAYANILADPSNDNFVYYSDSTYRGNQTDILQKYRKFNGQEGNSKSSTGTNVQSATNIPDAEDVNRDNSFDENEAYYEYAVPLTPLATAGNDLTSENLDSKNLKYYVEQIQDSSGSGRRWYHLRVPVSSYDKKYGQVNDFRNIRFMRLIMKGFSKETHIRFAKFDLIRNQWRRYQNSLTTPGFTVDPSNSGSSLELSAINIEENGNKKPFNYVVPPGIVRDNIVGSTGTNALQNEQSLDMKFTGLAPNQGRAAFKLFASDLRIYDRLKMFVHAESTEQPYSGNGLDGKMCAFMRIGSDFETNYYEYEIPLSMTKQKGLPINPTTPGQNFTGLVNEYADTVWNAANSFDFALQGLIAAKKLRNAKNAPLNEVYTIVDPENPTHKIKIKGNPDLGLVKGIMVGAYNKDGIPHQLELWVNELRVTGLNEHAGAAALARLDVKMADLGNVSISGNYLGIGYGGIDQRVLQRSREEVVEYNVIGNFEMGKFLKPKLGIHVPMTVQYGNKTTTPEYDPYDLDVKLADKLLATTDPTVRDSIARNAQTVQTINGISFNNVRKDRTSDKAPRPWNIENFSVSYAKTNLERHDPVVESEKRESTKSSLDYTFSMEPLYISPFKKLIKNEKVGKYLKFITDFHFNPLPNNFGFNTVLDRELNTVQYRFAGEEASSNTYYQRRFTWDRNYTLQWDLTRSLKLNFDAKNQSLIDELPDFDQFGAPTPESEKAQYINQSLKNFGRTKRYDQNINVNYTVPTRNIPFLEWINLRGTYGATYGWEAFSYNPAPNGDPENFKAIGNNINNRQNRQVNADLNFDNLYNTSKYLKKIQLPIFTDAPKVKKPKAKGNEAQNATDSLQNANGKGQNANNGLDKNAKAKKAKLPKDYEPSIAEKVIIRPLLLLRKARFNYTEQINSFVPGFTGDPAGNGQAGLFGMQNLRSPGWDYVLGAQEADLTWLEKARRNNWISTDIRQVKAALDNRVQTFDARITIEPFTDFKVDLDLNSNKVENQSVEFRNTSTVNSIDSIVGRNLYKSGSYTVSFLAINTFFRDPEDVFTAFDQNRPIVSNSLNPTGAAHPDYPGYKLGYGPTNQSVLVKSFMAAYLGKDVKTYDVNANLTNQLPRFNWRLAYNGLAKLPGLKDIFTSINITHGYKSTFTVNSFNSDQNFDALTPTKAQRESPNEYYSQYNIPTVVISEQFQPLLGIDVALKTGAIFGTSYRKSRNLALSLSDARLQESNVDEFTFKFGQRLKNIYIKFLDFNLDKSKLLNKDIKDPNKPEVVETGPDGLPVKKKKVKKAPKGNDLVLNFDVSYRHDLSANRLLGQGVTVPSRGSNTLRLSPSATYTVNKQMDLRFYIDYNMITPLTTAAFPSTNASGGFVVSFKLQ